MRVASASVGGAGQVAQVARSAGGTCVPSRELLDPKSCIYIYIYIYIYTYTYTILYYFFLLILLYWPGLQSRHTCHNLPPSEIDPKSCDDEWVLETEGMTESRTQ